MVVESFMDILLAGIVAGITAIILRAKQRQGIKGRKMKFSNAFTYYLTEFFFGSLAGILLSVFAEPVSLKQVMMFGIAAGANAEYVLEWLGKKLIHSKQNELDSVNKQERDKLGREDDNNDRERGSSH